MPERPGASERHWAVREAPPPGGSLQHGPVAELQTSRPTRRKGEGRGEVMVFSEFALF